MHLLATTSTSLDETVEAVDLGQPPGDLAVLSFADSDLAGLTAAWEAERASLPSVRLAHLRELRHPMSVDLWIDRVGAHAKAIVVRLLGGLDWWKYGVERLSALSRERGIALAVLPGEDRNDARLAAASTLPADELETLLRYFREGGRENLRALLRRLARYAGHNLKVDAPRVLPRHGGYLPGEGAVDLDRLVAAAKADRAVVPIIFYRAMLLAADTAPVDALYASLVERGLAPAPLMITSLKEKEAAAFLREALARLRPALIATMTAFAAGGTIDAPTPLDAADVPVLQVISATTKRAAWRDSQRGLGAADLAMHVVLPELDGRILAGAVAFKDPLTPQDGLAFTALASRPEADRVAMVADRIAALVHLGALPRRERCVAILMPDYPGAPGRTGYAVGLDVPASVVALLDDLAAAGYAVGRPAKSSRELLARLACRNDEATLSLAQYDALLARVPSAAARVRQAWGEPADDPDWRDGAFRFRAKRFGKVWVALPPDRGRTAERRADYHDASLPPRHALVAFGLWLQHVAKPDALVHMGAHGTLEWLPGKAVALTADCFPEIVCGPLPVIYPFIVSNPGEAAQAKRRLAGVTIGHLTPPLAAGVPLSGDARELERLIDEYAEADGLDRRRRERLATLIVDTARRTGLAREAGIADATEANDALRRIDAWLCDLKDLAIKDGLHVYGRAPVGSDDAAFLVSAQAERAALLAALDGRRVAPGPAGAPARGRRDVLPTGRNLFTADPRTLPTPTAMDFGRLAADEVSRAHMQTHGEFLRSAVIDLWGSATLRTGGEEIAQGFALLGCRPIWEPATGRVTGVEVLPTASLGRPRADVTWRISGLFRDLFPAQIALIDAAVQAIAARDEDDDENPLARARRALVPTCCGRLDRIFGNAPMSYGAGVEDLLGRGEESAEPIGAAYLAAASHSYGGAGGEGNAAPGVFAERIAGADVLVHSGDDPGRDLLEGGEDAAFIGGFAAAAKLLGRSPDLVMLDTTDPQRPRARALSAALARIVRSRAINPRFIFGQMRHGPRGAAELAETVDRLFAFAQTTDAVASVMFDLLYDAYVADAAVRDFLLRENPQAAAAIAERLEAARGRGYWHPRRNDVDADLAALRAETVP
jgi:cobaltochelatase CobN